VINSLIEQIVNEQYFHTNSKHSIDLSENNHNQNSTNVKSKKKFISSDELIQLYQQWAKSKFGRVRFTITSDDGYNTVSENLDDAWLTVVNLVRECRDDMNLTHLSMTNEELNGHKIFGLTKPIVRILLNQLRINLLPTQEQTKAIILPLSSSLNKNNSKCLFKKKNSNKKISSINSRLNVYQRKSHQRQRFGWLLNQNRKIEYALKSFEIDDALAHARYIRLAKFKI
jgi:hypothetical protein